MQYSVPQFIDIEDKVVGPFTAKQVLYLLAGGGFLMLIFTFFDFIFFGISFVFVAPIVLAFAFWKPSGMTVARWIMNIINFYTSAHLYIWKREGFKFKCFKKTVQKKDSSKGKSFVEKKKISKSRIKEMAWLLDTSTSVGTAYEMKIRPTENIFRHHK